MNYRRLLENAIGWIIGIFTLGSIRCFETQINHEVVDESDCDRVIKTDYRTFKKAFEGVEWEIGEHWRKSLFGTDYPNSKFHENYIKIKGVGYKLTTYGLLRARALKNRKIKQLNNLNK